MLIAAITELQPGKRVVPEGVVEPDDWLAQVVSWSRRWEMTGAQEGQPSAGAFGSVNLVFGEALGWL